MQRYLDSSLSPLQVSHMAPSRFGIQTAVILFMILGISCTCGKSPLTTANACLGIEGAQADHADSCGDTAECGNHFTCRSPDKARPELKCCLFADRTCTTEADCCPGQTCPSDRKQCFDKFVSCERDPDCGDRGDRFCEVYTDSYGSSSRCRFRPCSTESTCPDGLSCFQGECLADLPCGGTCGPGKGCVATIDRCQDYATPEGRMTAACPMTCNPGFIATFKNGRNIWDTCTLPNVACVCAELPSLRSNDLGRFSALDADPGKIIYSSTYDGQYGDLVVVRYGLDGARLGADYVDGVPAGTVKYGPSGARGGIADPGPDVGRYTDVVVSNGLVYVSYYDVTNGDLKVALRTADGSWSNHKVDGVGDVGLYSSIGVDSDGLPGVSYFMKAGDQTFDPNQCPGGPPTGERKFHTALKFARATTPWPQSGSDWVVRTIACLSRPAQPCEGCSETCADPGNGPACLPTASCATACASNTEACVLAGGKATCAKKYNPSTLVDVPMGVGMFSSMAFSGKEAVIAYMSRSLNASKQADGDLYAVRLSAQNVSVAAPVIIEAAGDTGYFPSVKFEPTSKSVAIAFHNFTTKTFKFYYSQVLQPGVGLETIDTGVDPVHPGEQGLVGTDSSLIFGPGVGQLWAVYQDATRGDLKIAAKRGASWAPQTVVSDGAVGFFADGVYSGGKLFTTHARLHARVVGGEPVVDNSLRLEALSAN